jgi:hypothetical protein
MENLPMDEAWTIQRKRRQGMLMKRKANLIAKAKKRKSKRFADASTLKKRAQKAARAIVFKKVSGGKTKGEIASAQQIIAIEKKLEKHQAKISKIANKILPKIKKAEAERLRQVKQGSIDPAKDAG